MGFICALLLMVLGLLTARDFVSEKVPALKKTIDAIGAYAESIGFAGLLIGFIWLLQALSGLRYMGLHVMLMLVNSLLMLFMGLMLGLPLLHKFMNEPTPGFLLKADKLSVSLAPHKKTIGLAAIVLGLLILIM